MIEEYEEIERVPFNFENPRGYFLMINNVNFKVSSVNIKLDERRGTDFDVLTFLQIFKYLDFNPFMNPLHENKTSDEIRRLLNNFANSDVHKKVDAVMVVLMSHGCRGCIFGSDSRAVYLHEIHGYFQKAENLKGKPKIFITQACQLEINDEILRQCVSPTAIPEGSFTDFYIINSAYEFTNAIREFQNGRASSPLIQSLQYVFTNERNKFDEFKVLMTKVLSWNAKYNPHQTPEVKDALIKKFYFFKQKDKDIWVSQQNRNNKVLINSLFPKSDCNTERIFFKKGFINLIVMKSETNLYLDRTEVSASDIEIREGLDLLHLQINKIDESQESPSFKKRKLKLKDIPKILTPGEIVQVIGGAGYGKTWFCYKLVIDIADQRDYVKNTFETSIYISFRGIQKHSITEKKTGVEWLKIIAHLNETVENFSTETLNKSKLLIILDGIDEYINNIKALRNAENLSKLEDVTTLPNLISNILQGKPISATVILTGRPFVFTEIDEYYNFDKYFRLIGLENDDIKSLCLLIADDNTVATNWYMMISNNVHLLNICHVPIFCNILFYTLQKRESSFITTSLKSLSAIMLEVILATLVKHDISNSNTLLTNNEIYSKYLKSIKSGKLMPILQLVARVSYSIIRNPNLEFTQSSLNISDNEFQKLMDCGLFLQIRQLEESYVGVIEAEKILMPMHALICEFMAAVHLIYNVSLTELKSELSQMRNLDFREVLIFSVGILRIGNSKKDSIDILRLGPEDVGFLIRAAAESENEDCYRYVYESLAFQSLYRVCKQLDYCLDLDCVNDTLELVALCQLMNSFIFRAVRGLQFSTSHYLFNEILPLFSCEQIAYLRIYDGNLNLNSKVDVFLLQERVRLALHHSRHITHLYLRSNCLSFITFEIVENFLKTNSQLRSLEIYGANESAFDFQRLFNAIKKSNVTELFLFETDLASESSLFALQAYLQSNLAINGIEITSSKNDIDFSSFKKLKNLESLGIARALKTDCQVGDIAEVIQAHRESITVLRLRECNTTIHPIINQLARIHHLIKLEIWKVELVSINSLCELLSNSSTLIELFINIDNSENDLINIVEKIPLTLLDFRFSANHIVSVSETVWKRILLMRELKVLQIRKTLLPKSVDIVLPQAINAISLLDCQIQELHMKILAKILINQRYVVIMNFRNNRDFPVESLLNEIKKYHTENRFNYLRQFEIDDELCTEKIKKEIRMNFKSLPLTLSTRVRGMFN